jgi:signal peptidase I
VELQTEVPTVERQSERSYRRLWCGLLSAVIPGMGDWFVGNRRRSALFLGLFALLVACFWPIRLPRFYWPFIAMILIGVLLHVVSGCCTFLVGRSSKDAAAHWWLLAVVLAALLFSDLELALMLRASGFRVFNIVSESMSPTVDVGDGVVVDTWYFRDKNLNTGDVVAFRHRGIFLMKRVLATGGSTIDGINERVELDGQPVTESYVVHRSPDHPLDQLDIFGPFHIPEGQIFVMGDNRDFSLDSRIRSGDEDYGPVFVADLVGKALYRFRRSIHGSSYDGQPVK